MKKILSGMFILLLALSLIGGSLVGCSAKSSSTSTTSTTTPLKEATLQIGLVSPQTGGAAPWGLAMVHGLELAFEDANNAGGVTIGDTHYTFCAYQFG